MKDVKRSARKQVSARRVLDDELRTVSRVARAGERLVQLSTVLGAIEPLLVLTATALILTVGAHTAVAQTPGGGIFGGSDQTVGNGVREAIRWARNILFLLGVGGCAWGALNVMLEKPYAKQFLGGGACMGFGAIASLAYSFAQGNAVDVDTDLGN